MKKCSACGRESFILNKNGNCVDCVFSIDGDGDNIFYETGKEIIHSEFVHESFVKYFGTEKPICSKCNKEVDIFGPIYSIKHLCTRFVFAKCHGEIEVKSFNSLSLPLPFKIDTFFD